jgi:acyl carrier protein
MTANTRFLCNVIARRARCRASAVHSGQNLQDDLDLTPLDLVLVAIEVEEASGIDIPVDALEYVETVSDLLQFFRRALSTRNLADDARSSVHATAAQKPGRRAKAACRPPFPS